jgi:hypothetical protein
MPISTFYEFNYQVLERRKKVRVRAKLHSEHRMFRNAEFTFSLGEMIARDLTMHSDGED